MANILKTRLLKLIESNEDLEVLLAQWSFDEKLINKSLNAISNLFPHFSLHDASHSKQILINIERLLGQNGIDQLSATDIWLLMESSYWHDIGMVIPHADQLAAEQSPEFIDLVNSIKIDTTHDLHKFCNQLDFTQLKPWLKIDIPIADFLQRYKELMAEYFRSVHASRSSEIVLNPVDSIGLQSPRNSLIPNRLFATLSQICLLHGSDFSEVEGRLPHKINGIGNEDCHPRFVACMLRLGDLLDIDDNRFCPTLQMMCGDNRPTLSKTHEKKHASIKDFSISPLEINISAICEDNDTYYETYQWFEWLKDEHKQQLLNWSNISPDEKRISLPSYCRAEVKVSGNQIIIDASKKQEFTINGNEALYLLGESLYQDRLLCMREIIQNAIDASAIKAWLEIEQKDFYKSLNDFPAAYRKFNSQVITNYPITITVRENKGLEIEIKDYGTGISLDDIHYLLNVATSKNNKHKNSIIQDMPEWMRPSGNFGVGFQSVFNITDYVEIISKCFFTNKITKIEAYSPRGNQGGKMIVTKLEPIFSEPSGTIVKFHINKEIIDETGTKTKFMTEDEFDKERNDFLDRARRSIDPLIHSTDTDKNLRIAAELIGRNCGISNNLHFKLIENTSLSSTAFSGTPFSMEPKKYFDIEICPALFRPGISVRYRGAPVQNLSLNGLLFSVEINILCGSAREWVTPDRKKLKQEKFKIIQEAIVGFIKENPNHLFEPIIDGQPSQDEINIAASLALDDLRLDEDIDLSCISEPQRNAYLNYEFSTSKGKKKLSELFKEPSLLLAYVQTYESSSIEDRLKDALVISHTNIDNETMIYLKRKLLSEKFNCSRHFFSDERIGGAELLYFNKKQTKKELEDHLFTSLPNYLIYLTKRRTLFACIAVSETDTDFEGLTFSNIDTIKDRLVKKIPLIHIVDLDIYRKESVKWVVLPFIFRRGIKSFSAESADTPECYKLAETVKELLDKQNLTTSKLVSLYHNLIRNIDIRMSKSKLKDDWSKLRKEHHH